MSPSKIQKCLINEPEDEQDIVPELGCTLDTLPPEVLEMIFKHLTYDEISKTVRLVSRRFQMIATSMLNNAFLVAGNTLKTVEKYLRAQVLSTTDKLETLKWQKNYNAMELIRAQYQMLEAVTWRYTHPVQCQKFFRLCFYAGLLLDVLFNVLNILRNNPLRVNAVRKAKPITEFIAICKRFMNHFEKVTERKVNKSSIVSGCKIIDILDCLIEGREVEAFRISANRGKKSGIVCMKIKYTIKRTWFTCLKVPNVANENSWRDEQRYMYLRLRRLVSSVNARLYGIEHFDTELELHAPQVPLPRPPPASVYYGCGEYGGKFFYYGNMNKFAYENKSRVAFLNDWADSESEEEEENSEDEGESNDFDLTIVAEIRCSPELAPLAVKPLLYSDDFEAAVPNPDNKLEIYLKLHITCPASLSSRLPGYFTWELRASQKK